METDTRDRCSQWWDDLDTSLLDLLADGGKTPRELSDKLGISEASVTSLISMLAVQGRVRISRVETCV
jgi:DNA-binding CsgD family transcriptional regulator